MTVVRTAVVLVATSLLAACSPSSYNLELRNNTTENIRVEMKAQKGNEAPTLAASAPMYPGQNITLFTQADKDAKVQVEARVQGDDKSPPAVRKIILGLSKLIVNPNPEAAKDPSKARLKIDEQK